MLNAMKSSARSVADTVAGIEPGASALNSALERVDSAQNME